MMLGWITTFLGIALTAGAFSIMPSPSDQAARLVFLVFAALFGVALILRGVNGPAQAVARGSAGPRPRHR